jgi:hypothetical protein
VLCVLYRKVGAVLLHLTLACDNFFEYIFESDGNNECDVPCRGDPEEVGGCGGPYIASTYMSQNSTFVIPALVPSVGLWQGLGCYTSVDVQTSRCRADSALVIRPVLVLFRSGSTLETPP